MENCRSEERKAIGQRIGMVRRCKGLSHVEFAQRLCVPQWATEIAEHGICTEEGIVDNASPFLVDMPALIREIAIEFNVSEEWLQTGEGKPPRRRKPAPEEKVFYVPMTLSTKYFEEELSLVMKILDLSADSEYDRSFAKRLTLQELLDLLQNYIHEQSQTNQEIRIEEMIEPLRAMLTHAMY